MKVHNYTSEISVIKEPISRLVVTAELNIILVKLLFEICFQGKEITRTTRQKMSSAIN